MLEAVLKGAGWPADAGKIRAAMENVKVDTKGLRGGPIEWSKDNHFRDAPVLPRLPLGSRRSRRSRSAKDWIGVRREVTSGSSNQCVSGQNSASRFWRLITDTLSPRAVQLIVNIIVLAAIYALLACGYVLIYRVSRVMNMAHGELSMLGAYLLFADRLAVRRPPRHRDRRRR